MANKRIYIITESSDVPPQKHYTNLRKLVEMAGEEYDLPSYSALYKRIERAKDRTGKALIRLKDQEGKTITVEIKEVNE